MAKFFVVSTDPLTAEQETAFRAAIGAGPGWWHWLPNFWLIRDGKGQLTAGKLRDSIHDINKEVRAMVAEVTPVTWAALTRNDAHGNDMGDWIKSNWKNP